MLWPVVEIDYQASTPHAASAHHYIQTPLLLSPFTTPPACMPTHAPTPPSVFFNLIPSSNRLVKNPSVSTKSLEVSVVMNKSALAYIAARAARLVYQAEVTVVLPARKSSSSERKASSRIDVGRWIGVERRASA